MTENKGDDEVMFCYESSRNITFHGKDGSGYTKDEWRKMSESDQDEALREYLYDLVDVYVDNA